MAIDKHRGKWRARWRDATGRQRAKTFTRKADAQAWLHTVATDDNAATPAAPVSVAELADQWLAASPNLAPTTVDTYRRDLDRYILPAFGSRRADTVTAAAIQTWLGTELDTYAPSSVHRHYRTIRRMYAWAIAAGLARSNPCDGVNPPRIVRQDVEVFTVEQVEAIAANITPRYRAMILVAAYGGLRLGEVTGLRRRDVDGASVMVVGQVQKQVRTGTTKTLSSRRRVALPASVAAELAAHLDRYTGPGDDDLVFVNQLGKPIGHSWRGSVWAPACVKAGMGKRAIKNGKPSYAGVPKPHNLRHTMASLAITAGAHPKVIQQRLGHSSITVTMDTYGHLFAGVDEALADDLDAMRLNRD